MSLVFVPTSKEDSIATVLLAGVIASRIIVVSETDPIFPFLLVTGALALGLVLIFSLLSKLIFGSLDRYYRLEGKNSFVNAWEHIFFQQYRIKLMNYYRLSLAVFILLIPSISINFPSITFLDSFIYLWYGDRSLINLILLIAFLILVFLSVDKSRGIFKRLKIVRMVVAEKSWYPELHEKLRENRWQEIFHDIDEIKENTLSIIDEYLEDISFNKEITKNVEILDLKSYIFQLTDKHLTDLTELQISSWRREAKRINKMNSDLLDWNIYYVNDVRYLLPVTNNHGKHISEIICKLESGIENIREIWSKPINNLPAIQKVINKLYYILISTPSSHLSTMHTIPPEIIKTAENLIEDRYREHLKLDFESNDNFRGIKENDLARIWFYQLALFGGVNENQGLEQYVENKVKYFDKLVLPNSTKLIQIGQKSEPKIKKLVKEIIGDYSELVKQPKILWDELQTINNKLIDEWIIVHIQMEETLLLLKHYLTSKIHNII
ncbi:MAG: hypothetical protein HeimC3_39610 [Candidatus Heimdallarchaeota archaeon LC_3]|nr:MAG: hypothetical protein HeimC3_39610 [Candidatus Heimdallarchaeota archaeon LC_3]